MKHALYTFSLICLITLQTGCATAAGYKKTLSTWIGYSSTDLIGKLGVPKSSISLPDGGTALEYVQSSEGFTTYQKNAMTGQVYAYQVGESYCRTTFRADKDGKITGFSFQGNACKD